MTVSEEHSQGYLAGRSGAPLSANPYTDRSLLGFQQWRKGWLQAELDIDAVNVEVQFREVRR